MNEQEKEALNWRWKKLMETPEVPEEPQGLIETIDAFIWGKQSWEQKEISCPFVEKKGLLQKIIRG